MAALATRVNVTNVEIQISPTTDSVSDAGLVISNRGAAAVYLGATGVLSTTGFQLDPGVSVTISDYASRDAIFAIAATAGPFVVHTFRVGS